MTPHQRSLFAWCGLASFLSALDGSVLFLTLPAIAKEFHAPLPSLANAVSIVALGALGTVPLGLLADRRGRRTVLAGATLAFGLSDLASALAPSLTALAVLRLVAVVFELTAAEVALVMVVEEMPAQHRGLGAAAMTFAAGAGAGVTTVAYPFIAPHWRLLYVLGAVALPAAALLAWRLPETGVWEQAKLLPPIRWRGAWVRWLWIGGAAAAVGAVLYEPAAIFVTLYGSRDLRLSPGVISAVIVASGVVAAACYPLGGLLTDRLGRRRPAVLLALANALGAGAVFGGGTGLYWGGSIGFAGLNSAAGPVFGAWVTELYPTRVRVTAETIDVVAGALGGIVGLQLSARLAGSVGLAHAILLEVLFGVAGALLLLLLPETRGRPLEA
jgi:MFS family permease